MKRILSVLALFAFFAYINCDSCVQCNSKTEERCATDPLNILAKECVNSSSVCYVRVQNGYTIRGCASDLDNATLNACHNELECVTCNFLEGCNRQVFPTSRAQCLQCSGNSTDSLCATQVYAQSSICPTYKIGDKCYIRNSNRTVSGSFQRGCLTTAQANKQCIKDGNCYTCEGRGCNFLPYNDTLIPLARDSSSVFVVQIGLLVVSMLAAWML
ncbi:uncharacterized protein [Drosophila tropicalis]|uniref:uncharacterized protein n=1 Tax=Drosophila tropicalis TaxID=46794 RepID=UPI0035ABD925